jgi:hypothetical protein
VLSDADIEDRLHAILAAPEFQGKPSDYFQRWLASLLVRTVDWLSGLPSGTRWLLVLICVLLLVGLVIEMVASVDAGATPPVRRTGYRDDHADVGEEPDRLAQAARRLAAAGRLREAARTLQQAAFVSISRRRGLPWRPDLADWEWVALLGHSPVLDSFTRQSQRVAYGPGAEIAEFAVCERLYVEISAGST